MTRTDLRELSPLEIRIAAVLVFAGLLGTQWFAPAQAGEERPAAYSSHAAVAIAHDLQSLAESLDYDDPRLAATEGFEVPDGSFRDETPAEPGYLASWKIVDDQPARRMKTIEVRVRWPGEGEARELSVVSVKAS